MSNDKTIDDAAKKKLIEAKEEEINQLYNQKSKAKEYENYDIARECSWKIEELEEELLKLISND